MAYLIVADRNDELDRIEVIGAVRIGRALDCEVSVHDAMLSRHHCTIEPIGERWVVVDQKSRNGTFISGERIHRHILADGEVIRIGRTRLCFFSGSFVPTSIVGRWTTAQRPRDPTEALAGTIMGLPLNDMNDDSVLSGFPIPRPKPAEPSGYEDDQIHELVTSMSSGIWDTKLMTEAPPARSRVLPQPKFDRQRYVLPVKHAPVSANQFIEPRRHVVRKPIPRAKPTRAQTMLVAASIISAVAVCLSSTLVLFLA